MQIDYGKWRVAKGKNNRIYINCTDPNIVAHPQELCHINGLLIYDYDNLADLAIAILKYEKLKQESESILNSLNNEK